MSTAEQRRENYTTAITRVLGYMKAGADAGIGKRHRRTVALPRRARVYRFFHRRWPREIEAELYAARKADAEEWMAYIRDYRKPPR